MAYTIDCFSDEVTRLAEPVSPIIKGRYDNKIKLRLNSDRLIVRNLKESDLVPVQSPNDIIHTVTLDEDERPDLIAQRFYNDPRMYWVILAANDMRERSQLKKGSIVRIPAMATIYGSKGILLK
jgi:hypothetical protein